MRKFSSREDVTRAALFPRSLSLKPKTATLLWSASLSGSRQGRYTGLFASGTTFAALIDKCSLPFSSK